MAESSVSSHQECAALCGGDAEIVAYSSRLTSRDDHGSPFAWLAMIAASSSSSASRLKPARS